MNVPPLRSAGCSRSARARSARSRRRVAMSPDSARVGPLNDGRDDPVVRRHRDTDVDLGCSCARRRSVQLAFIAGWVRSDRADEPRRARSVWVSFTPCDCSNAWRELLATPPRASWRRRRATTKKCGTVVQLCVVRSAIKRPIALSGPPPQVPELPRGCEDVVGENFASRARVPRTVADPRRVPRRAVAPLGDNLPAGAALRSRCGG